MTERRRESPEPYGYWAVFSCGSGRCPVCLGPCRHEERIYIPDHWRTGGAGQIAPL